MPMVKIIPITKARIGLGGIVQDILKHKRTYIFEKSGTETVAMLEAQELQDLRDTLEVTQRLLREKIGTRVKQDDVKLRYGL